MCQENLSKKKKRSPKLTAVSNRGNDGNTQNCTIQPCGGGAPGHMELKANKQEEMMTVDPLLIC